MQEITALPTAPSRARPIEFSGEADAFLGALPAFGTQLNTLAGELNTSTITASVAATTATTKVNESAASAVEAGNYALAAQTAESNTQSIYVNAGSMLGINFGAFTLTDGELIVTHLSTSTPSLVDGDLILTYETL